MSPANNQTKDNNNHLGSIIFDDIVQHKTGWCIRNCDSDVSHVPGLHVLESQTIWLTNLPWGVMIEGGLAGHSMYRPLEYFKIPLHKINSQLGIDEDLKKQAVVFSNFFDRIHKLANHFLGIDGIDQERMVKSIRREVSYNSNDLMYDKDFANKISSAISHYTNVERESNLRGESSHVIDLWIPALQHAKAIFETPLPIGKWERVKQHKLPGKANIMEWVMELSTPALVNVNVYNVSPQISSIINFGSGNINSKENRSWITSNELLSLLPVADIKINEAIQSQSLVVLDNVQKLLSLFPEESNLSLSTHIFLDNLWSGFTVTNPPLRYKQNKESLILSRKGCQNIVCPFFKAEDRFLCLEYVAKLISMGYNPLGYGAGKIKLDATDLEEEDIFLISKELGLIPPAGSLTDIKNLNFDFENNPFDLLLVFLAQGRIDDLMNLDGDMVETLLQIDNSVLDNIKIGDN